MQWFRFYSEALDDPKVQRLPGDLFKAWVNLLCLANEQDERGLLPSLEDIAFRLRLDEAAAVDIIGELTRRQLLEYERFDRLVVHAWSKRQPESDSSTERVRRHRAKQHETVKETGRNNHETLQKRSGNALDKNRIDKTRGEESRPDIGDAAAPQQPARPPRPIRNVPKPKDEPPKANPWWDALIAGVGVAPATEGERSVYGKAVRELRALDATPGDILARCANYRDHWPEIDLTVPALLKHWSRMEHPPPARASPNSTPRRPTTDDRNRELLEQIRRQENGHEPNPFPGAIDADWVSHKQSPEPRTVRPVVAEVRRPAG